MADYSDPLGLLFGGVDYFGSPQKSKGLLQLTPQEIERMAAAQSPAFGVFPQMQPYRSQQDITASANVPVDVARGRVAGTLGLFGDVFNQPIPMVRPLQLLSQAMTGQQKYPDTEYFLENLPLKSDTPVGDVAGRVASFAPINPMPAVRGAQKLGGLLGDEIATRVSTGRPILPSLLAEPQTAMFAVEPNPSMAMADESSAMRQQLTDKMQALLAQKKIATSAVDVGSINQQIGELQAQFKSLPAMGRVAREVVVPEITAPVSNIGFYSATEQAAMNLERGKGTGQSFLNDLMNAPDVKNYEIEAMGLDTYLRGKPNVTRQEVQDFIQNNKINVEERQLGGTITEDPIGIAKRKEIFDRYEPQIQDLYRRIDKPEYVVYDPETNKVLKSYTNYDDALLDNLDPLGAFGKTKTALRPKENSRQLQQQITDLQNIRDAEADAAYIVPESAPTKYGQFQLAGGENYRELLLTLPEKTPAIYPDFDTYFRAKYSDYANPNNFENPSYIMAQRDAKRNWDAMGGKIEIDDFSGNKVGLSTGNYTSSHFDQPNILAHMRVNDRVDAEGKKMLLIEEVQSDWHQAGREKGYASPEADKAKQAFADYSNELADKYNVNPAQNIAMYATMKGIKPEEIAKYEQLQSAWVKTKDAVPDAPFKDTWYQLALKRAIKEAVDKGYDRIGLTTGKQQADRYKLSNEVDEINIVDRNYMTTGEKIKQVALDMKSGQSLKLGVNKDEIVIDVSDENIQNFMGKKLSEVVGKDIAKEIMTSNKKTISGEGLDIGGQGMKKYYDEIYPNFLNKYGKKYGAQVGETEIGLPQKTSSSWAYFRDWFAENHSDVGSSATALSNWEKGSNNKYVKEFEKFRKTPTQKETVRYLDITPEMRKAVQKGQPLAAVEGMTGLLA